MTTHYKILRTVTPDDLDTRPRFVEVLKIMPSEGYVTRNHFKNIEKNHITRGLMHACSIGILQRVSPHDQVLNLESVKFWCTQLNDSNLKNTVSPSDTRKLYLNALSRLNGWLPGRQFPSHKTVMSDGQITRAAYYKVVCKCGRVVALLYRVRTWHKDCTTRYT